MSGFPCFGRKVGRVYRNLSWSSDKFSNLELFGLLITKFSTMHLLIKVTALLLLSIGCCFGQQNPIMVGDTMKGTLLADGEQEFSLILKSDQFVFGEVNQISVDVVVHIIGPDGEELETFDGPGVGPEPFQFDAEEEGTYTLHIESFKKEEGDFTLTIHQVEPIATDPSKRVDQLLAPYDNDYTPGAVVGVVQNGETLFAKGYGMANLSYGIPFTLENPTNIGSVSKQFTAMAILLLEKEGELSLDDDVRKHLPELPNFGQIITLRNMLTHTTGWREMYNTMPMTGWKMQDFIHRETAIQLLQSQPELQANPGETFNYNNTAFILLAEIVERVTGENFPDWMKKNVFEPLNMNKTMVRSNPSQIVPNGTTGYSYGEQGIEEAGDLHAAYGAGGIYTTVADLHNWLKNFGTHQLGGPKLMEKLTTPYIFSNGDTSNYALGIGVGEYRGQPFFQHTGGDNAHVALLAYYPEIDAGVITMANSNTYQLRVARKIGELFFGSYFESVEEEDSPAVEKGEIIVPETLLKKYAGNFKMDAANFTIEYRVEDGKFIAQGQGQPSIELVATSDTTFNYKGVPGAYVTFHEQGEPAVHKATHFQGAAMKMTRLAPYNPDAALLSSYVGTYFSEELQTVYRIELKEDQLVANRLNLKDIELDPIKKDEFSGEAFFFSEIEFIRNEEGQIAAFTASNGRTAGVLFERRED